MKAFVNWKIIAGAALVAASTAGCGDVVRQGEGGSYLIVDSLQGRRGAVSPGIAGNPLASDVLTMVTSPDPCKPTTPCPTTFSDTGLVTLRLLAKDVTAPIVNPSNMDVTINRYHVHYRRADGRNTPGVDVPWDFDGGLGFTIPSGGKVDFAFELVRNAAKLESPLVQLVDNPTIITTIAEITFYGHDVVGNTVSVTGSMVVDFGNFGDF